MSRPKRPELKPYTVYLNPNTFRAFKAVCKSKGIYISDALAKTMTTWMKQVKEGKKARKHIKTASDAEKYFHMENGTPLESMTQEVK